MYVLLSQGSHVPLLLFSELSTAHPGLPLAHAPSACFLGTSSCKLSPAVEMRVLGNLMLFPIPVGSKTAFFLYLLLLCPCCHGCPRFGKELGPGERSSRTPCMKTGSACGFSSDNRAWGWLVLWERLTIFYKILEEKNSIVKPLFSIEGKRLQRRAFLASGGDNWDGLAAWPSCWCWIHFCFLKAGQRLPWKQGLEAKSEGKLFPRGGVPISKQQSTIIWLLHEAGELQ